MSKIDNNPFQSIFDHSSIGMIIVNRDGTIIKVNSYAENIFGYEKDELLGQKIEVLIPEALRAKHVGQRDSFAKNPIPRSMGMGIDLAAIKKSGEEISVEISLSSYKSGDELNLVAFVSDITERKNIKEQLKSQARELEEKFNEKTQELSVTLLKLNETNNSLTEEIARRKEYEKKILENLEAERELSELKSRFVSMASHEFRTPLAGILTSVSLIEKYKSDDALDAKRDKHVKTIKKSIRNLTSILNDFLSSDKLEQGKIGTNPTHFDVINFIEETTSEQFEVNSGYKYEIIYNQDEFEAYQDKDMLRNVLINLLSNAIKYSTNKKEIKIKIYKINQDFFEFTIQDSGIGIPKVEQEQLFERFFRSKKVINIQGTGLGLYIVKRYVVLMGGEITFKSEEGVGTSFNIKLPTRL